MYDVLLFGRCSFKCMDLLVKSHEAENMRYHIVLGPIAELDWVLYNNTQNVSPD